MGKKEDLFSRVFIAVVLIGALGSIVIGIILIFVKSVWLGIGVYIVGQLVSGLPFLVLGRIGLKNKSVDSMTTDQLIIALDSAYTKKSFIESIVAEDETDDSLFAGIAEDWWSSWKNHPNDTSELHFAVRSGKRDTPEDSRKDAKRNVDIALAQYLHHTDMTYVTKDGNITEVTSIQQSKADLTQARYKYHFAEDGTCYVLAALPIGESAEKLKAEIREAFAQNTSSEANEKMQRAIDKYFVTDSEKTDQE